jgi:hypothetical protein
MSVVNTQQTATMEPEDAPHSDVESTLLEELVAFARHERNDLAIRLLELNALHVEGELTDDEFAERRAELYAA